MNKELIKAFNTILNESEDKLHYWIEWIRPMIASMLKINEEEVEDRYYYQIYDGINI